MTKGDTTGVMQLGTYANPKLAMHSTYFGALDKMMKCVDRFSHVAENKHEMVCKKEMTALRKAAFED